MSSLAPCPGCDAVLAVEDGPTHAYMLSSPACWALYGEVMAREYASAALMEVHFLTVDAFAVQHPGSREDRRARQSVWIHLAGLKAVLRDGRTMGHRYDLLRRLAERKDFPPQPGHEPFAITCPDMAPLVPDHEHAGRALHWADAALSGHERANSNLGAMIEKLSD